MTFTNGYELRGIRRLHVNEEPYADARMRARKEAKEAEKAAVKKEPATPQAQQQQYARWFHNSFMHELMDGGLYQAIGETIADAKREARDQARAEYQPKIEELQAKNEALEKRLGQLEQMLTAKAQVEEAVARLDARALAREEGRRGKMGPQGQRGARGERGLTGASGPSGKPAEDRPVITAFRVNIERSCVVSYLSNGQQGPIIDLFPFAERLYERFLLDASRMG
jgi:hypothetical protein